MDDWSGDDGTVWSSLSLLSGSTIEQGTYDSMTGAALQYGATGLSALGAIIETASAFGGAIFGITIGPSHTVEGLAGFAFGGAAGNAFYQATLDPLENITSFASTAMTWLSDSRLGNTRIDRYEDHINIVVGQASATSAALTVAGAQSRAGIVDVVIDAIGSFYASGWIPGMYDISGSAGKSEWFIGPWIQLQYGDT